ncbi:DUF1612 domain-containing protein [Neorhizobium lilium]|uniref:DUF1612 domain-containing protein n=1 Tax=Neorhizobium lilium TaxID=2503024 RepID=A0A444LMW6_9HYPH|nr:RHE_PE00001 family protein [Neorhizobium lilium]RWX81707.1 DUF1612 domain-containing protein [Neorhizobium lilium]
MAYDLARLSLQTLISPIADATAAVVRLDERLSRSSLREGYSSRSAFVDACASLWLDGELVHLEDLVFHDAGMGVRTPTHELNIALDVLRTRRKILVHPPAWALSIDGLRSLRGREGGVQSTGALSGLETKSVPKLQPGDEEDALTEHLSAIDAVLARSEALLDQAAKSSPIPSSRWERHAFLYEPDWDEDERLEEWQAMLRDTEGLPPVLRAALLLDAWNTLQVLQHAPWLGRLLVGALLRQSGLTQAHLPEISVGLKLVPREDRTSRSRTQRLTAYLAAMRAGAEAGLKEHDRLLLAQQQMQRRLVGRRQTSRLPQLIDLVLSRPMVSAGMIAEALSITPQGALKIAAELNLRELTGRGRFRAWGIL